VGSALAAAGLLGVVLSGISLLDDVPDPAPASVSAVVPVQMTPTPRGNPRSLTPRRLPPAQDCLDVQTGQDRLSGPG
jgi:hypothetical protein